MFCLFLCFCVFAFQNVFAKIFKKIVRFGVRKERKIEFGREKKVEKKPIFRMFQGLFIVVT